MNGYYIIGRIWVGFSDTFPWFDELNPLSDDIVSQELNKRARTWLAENKSLIKARYREERAALEALAKQLRSRRHGVAFHPLPTMSLMEKSQVEWYVGRLSHAELTEEASRYGIQLAMTDDELRRAIIEAREKEHLQLAMMRRKRENEEKARSAKEQFDIKKRVRGDRAQTTMETRIARLAGWLIQDVHDFGPGALSPTSRLLLHWTESANEADALLKLASARFASRTWEAIPPRVSVMPCKDLSATDITSMELQTKDLLDPESRWLGSGLARWVTNEFKTVAQQYDAITRRDRGQLPVSPTTQGGPLPSASVADVVKRERKEWFTVFELSRLSGLTEHQIDGRIRRWANKGEVLESVYRLQLPEASSGAARFMYRIDNVWPLLSDDAEISQENSE